MQSLLICFALLMGDTTEADSFRIGIRYFSSEETIVGSMIPTQVAPMDGQLPKLKDGGIIWINPPDHTVLTLELAEEYLEWCEVDTVVIGVYGGTIHRPRATPTFPGFIEWMRKERK